jgi:hypothetical protein
MMGWLFNSGEVDKFFQEVNWAKSGRMNKSSSGTGKVKRHLYHLAPKFDDVIPINL